MPRFYFDLLSSVIEVPSVYDHEGVSLPSAKHAEDFAGKFARRAVEVRRRLRRAPDVPVSWSVAVSNGRFERLLTMPLRDGTGPSK
jgi:uncharacterized protein DUF6894